MAKVRGGASNATFTSTTLADVGSPIPLYGDCEDIVFRLDNTGAALTDFALLVKASDQSDTYHTIISGATWGTVSGNLKEVVGTLNTLASGAAGYAHVNVGPVQAVKFQASIAAGSTAINIYVTGN